MIRVIYWAGLGNRLFQYCFGRIIAEGLGYELDAKPIPGFPNTNTKIIGCNYKNRRSEILTGQKVNIKKTLSDTTKRKIVLNKGYFQQYLYYKKYKSVIKSNWLKTKPRQVYKQNSMDIVICVRRKDYIKENSALPLSYYIEALSVISHRQVFICTDDPSDPFIYILKKLYHAEVSERDTADDFEFIKSFNKIIISNSSFHWWAAFLSKAKEIAFPIPKEGFWSRDSGINLRVDDEKRYVYIKCKNKYKESFLEHFIKVARPVKRLIFKNKN